MAIKCVALQSLLTIHQMVKYYRIVKQSIVRTVDGSLSPVWPTSESSAPAGQPDSLDDMSLEIGRLSR
jgi:hypothetical protein